MPNILKTGGSGGLKILSEVDKSNTTTTVTYDVLPIPNYTLSCCKIDNHIYSFESTGTIIYDYDWNKKTLTEESVTYSAKATFEATAYDGLIYICGGQKSSTYYKTCERYNPITKTIEEIASMNYNRSAFGLASLDGCLYAMQGKTSSSNYTKTAEKYTIATNTWETIATASTEKGAGVAFVVNGRIHYAGGMYQSGNYAPTYYSVNQGYTPSTNTWSSYAGMSQARISMVKCGIYDKDIAYLLAGQYYDGYARETAVANVYNGITNTMEAYSCGYASANSCGFIINNAIQGDKLFFYYYSSNTVNQKRYNIASTLYNIEVSYKGGTGTAQVQI